jgi:hypothetical protein
MSRSVCSASHVIASRDGRGTRGPLMALSSQAADAQRRVGLLLVEFGRVHRFVEDEDGRVPEER